MGIQDKTIYSGVPSGFDAVVLSEIAQEKGLVLYVASSDTYLFHLKRQLSVVAPKIPVLVYPEWDTVPYDRADVADDIVSCQADTLSKLPTLLSMVPSIVLTTVRALIQKTPPVSFFKGKSFTVTQGQEVSFSSLQQFLQQNGYVKTSVVHAAGEYALRGGILDVFVVGYPQPVRIDFFGDLIDSLRLFDSQTQRTIKEIDSLSVKSVSLYDFTVDTRRLFNVQYRHFFPQATDSVFLEAIRSGVPTVGLSQFMPLFHSTVDSFFDYIQPAVTVLPADFHIAKESVFDNIREYYTARQEAVQSGAADYYPLPPSVLYLTAEELEKGLQQHSVIEFSPFVIPNTEDKQGRAGLNFATQSDKFLQQEKGKDVFSVLKDYIQQSSKNIILTAGSYGSLKRLQDILKEKELSIPIVSDFDTAVKQQICFLEAPFETGFVTQNYTVLTETDILGTTLSKPVRKRKKDSFLTDVMSLSVGDLLVHQQHGIGRFEGLEPVNVAGVPHDCLCLVYAKDSKLFVPVENMDVLSRYGSTEAALDTLGSSSFQQRKEKAKKDLFIMAGQLLEAAATRVLKSVRVIEPERPAYQAFCARFPFSETEDQLRTMAEIERDLSMGKPMDRLVCGDVGFGKTEMALRTAFLVAYSGQQVAVVVPTTLLAQQHYENFKKRFADTGLKVAVLSRLVNGKTTKAIYADLQAGKIDIVIGTHAVLNKKITFKELGLVIIDEEQHFGVLHKERLKTLRQGVHVLTLTATPIPRTLQLSLSGVKELSLITTPPVDRLAIKTYVMPFDTVMIKEAILKEQFRGGQVFLVCPRVSDLSEMKTRIEQVLPTVKIVIAHGQMPPKTLEQIMDDFVQQKYDVLLTTSIVESGLDMPLVNTIIIHRADMFGLSALYQLRGRVGRGKRKAYAYLTTPTKMTPNAQKRLSVMQTLDSLGAGFSLASYDLDIRGAGNLLGEKQSGHIKEIGVALYQKMLSDAVRGLQELPQEEDFSPHINLGIPVLIPDTYIADFEVRMDLYTRLGELREEEEITAVQQEFLDRFGPYPDAVENLLAVLRLKILCKKAKVIKLDVGSKGAVLSFYKNEFSNPEKLISFIQGQFSTVRLKPTGELQLIRAWTKLSDRIKGVSHFLNQLIALQN